MLAHLENRKNVGMVQSGSRFGLLLEAPQPLGIARNERRQHLDGYIPLQAKIPCSIDFPHPAGSKQRKDFEVSQFCSLGEPQAPIRSRLQATRAYLVIGIEKRFDVAAH